MIVVDLKPEDGGDFAPAWERAVAAAVDGDTILVPPGAYTSSRPVQVTRRVLVIGWGATVLFQQCAGFWLRSKQDPTAGGGADRSVFVGLEIRSTSKADPTEHGFAVDCPARMVWCVARKFGGDGFRVLGDVVAKSTNANGGALLGCESTGHGGRGFSWVGGDSNAWMVFGCTTSDCVGGGFGDASFLGNYFFGCHSGVHPAGAIGYHLNGDASYGAVLGCYQEGGHTIRVDGSNVALGCVGAIDPTGTGFAMRGSSVVGRMVLGGLGAIGAKLTINPAGIDGRLADLRSALDTYGVALHRETAGPRAGWWTLRRANTASQDLLAVRADAKAQVPPALWAPLGIQVGATQRLVDAAWVDSVEGRLAKLEARL